MSNEAVANELVDHLDEVFDGLKIDFEREESAGLNCFLIELDAAQQMILKISDGCIASNDISAVKASISETAKSAMEANPNKNVILNDDLSVEVA